MLIPSLRIDYLFHRFGRGPMGGQMGINAYNSE